MFRWLIHPNTPGVLLLLVLLAFGAGLCTALGDVRAQEQGADLTPTQSRLALLLARTCVAEIGFQDSVNECQLMWQINADNAIRRGRSLSEQTLKFNGYWKSPKQRQRRPWIAYLADENKPRHWPKNLSWKIRREKWARYLAAARAYVSDPLSVPVRCLDAMDYGGPHEVPRSRWLIPTDCGNTKQRYWRWRKRG